ncbi:MAG: hypothetical protein GF317_09775 [Candidatus Lokiarchaeota archaeon]|nr:hypothetical protein [Candidatus Lokiarchaeota archaeon]
MSKKKKVVSFHTDEKGNKYPYVDIGKGRHSKIFFRLWISKELISESNNRHYIYFPIMATIEETDKESLVLKVSDKFTTYDIFVKCGFRGHGEFEILSPYKEKFDYKIYHSQLGNLGISGGALVTSSENTIKYRWEKSGRLYGKSNHGITIINQDGKVSEIDEIPDGLEALDELPKFT